MKLKKVNEKLTNDLKNLSEELNRTLEKVKMKQKQNTESEALKSIIYIYSINTYIEDKIYSSRQRIIKLRGIYQILSKRD